MASSVALIVAEAVAMLPSAAVAVVGTAVGPPCGTLGLDNLDIPGEKTRTKDTLSNSSSVHLSSVLKHHHMCNSRILQPAISRYY